MSSDRRQLYGRRRPSTRLLGKINPVGRGVRGRNYGVYTNIKSPAEDRAIFLKDTDPAAKRSVPIGAKVTLKMGESSVVTEKSVRVVAGGRKRPVLAWNAEGRQII